MAKLFITVSPSAGGKTTINRRLVESIEDLKISISYTSRALRPGDREGVDYFFITDAEFAKRIKEGEFIEYARVHEKYYGTSKAELGRLIKSGFDVLLEIDVQGATQIRNKFSDAVSIFILPPGFEALKQRLKARRTDNKQQIEIRLKDAKKELEEAGNYDYIVVNDDVVTAVDDMSSIIRSERLKVDNSRDFLENFIDGISLK